MAVARTVKPGKFEIPPNYSQEEVGEKAEPWLEDLEDDDVELWIMQTPPNVNISKIQGQFINFDGPTYFDCEGILGNKLESLIMPNTSSKGLQCNLIAPSKEDKKYHVVKKPFSGHIMLTEFFDLPECQGPEEYFDQRKDCPDKPKQRFFPYGSHFIEQTQKKRLSKAKSKSPKNVSKIEFSSSDAEVEPCRLKVSQSEIKHERKSNDETTSDEFHFKVPKNVQNGSFRSTIAAAAAADYNDDDECAMDQSGLSIDANPPSSADIHKKKKRKKESRHESSTDEASTSMRQVSKEISADSSDALSQSEKWSFEKLLKNIKQEPMSPTSAGSSGDHLRKKKKKKDSRKDSFSPDVWVKPENPPKDRKKSKKRETQATSSDAGSEMDIGPLSSAESTVYSGGKKSKKHKQKSQISSSSDASIEEREETGKIFNPDKKVSDVQERKPVSKRESLSLEKLELSQSTQADDSDESIEKVTVKKKKKKSSKDFPDLEAKGKRVKKKSSKFVLSSNASTDTEAYPEESTIQKQSKSMHQEPLSPALKGLKTCSERTVPNSSEVIHSAKKKKKKKESCYENSAEEASTSKSHKSKKMSASSSAISDANTFSQGNGNPMLGKILKNLKQEPLSPSSAGSSDNQSKKKKKKKGHEESTRNYDDCYVQYSPIPQSSGLCEGSVSEIAGTRTKKLKIKKEPLTPERSMSWSKSFSNNKGSHNAAVYSSVKEEHSNSGSDGYANTFSRPYSLNDSSVVKSEFIDVKPDIKPDIPTIAVQATSYELPKDLIKKAKSSKKDKLKKTVKREPLSP